MSDSQLISHSYTSLDAEKQRVAAVNAALELIAARISSADGTQLLVEMQQLSGYADLIQAAIKK